MRKRKRKHVPPPPSSGWDAFGAASDKKICEDSTESIQTQQALELELKKLQVAYGQALLQMSELRRENNVILKRCAQEEERQSKCNEAVRAAKEQIRLLEKKSKKLEKSNEKTSRQLMRLQVKYDSLAQSRLGRLTLWYWNWLNKKKKTTLEIEQTAGAASLTKTAIVDRSQDAQSENEVQRQEHATQRVDTDVLYEPSISKEQMHWFDCYADQVNQIADSNGTRYFHKLSCRVGLICDEFFYESICDAADFVFMTPKNWKKVINEGIQLFLFVSTWRGLNGEWRGLASIRSRNTNPRYLIVMELLEECNKRNIPTVFYSKEDPPNYQLFLDYAKKCDFIFTSAQECAPYYQSDCQKKCIGVVPFGINPQRHNPIGLRQFSKAKEVLFSGSWMEKYPDRCNDLSKIFDGILSAGHNLHIIDRNYPKYPAYMFPEKYLPYISPALNHNILQKVHKLFDWAVNINSVTQSETMFANRAFELQAAGVLLLSNYSVGVNSMLPTVMIVQDGAEVSNILNNLSDEERYERQIAGVRLVMTGHTCFDRLAQLLNPTGIETMQPVRKILVIAKEITKSVNANFQRQTYTQKVLMDEKEATAEKLAEYDMVTWFSLEAFYGEFYLEDLSNGFKYTACDYITKNAWYEGESLHAGIEHDYISEMESKERTLFWREAFEPEFLLSLEGARKLANGYSIDHFNYNASPLLVDSPKKKYSLSVIIPVYNNGWHLYGKCFASLLRSSLFKDMEIILVDDGSTDGFTPKMESYLKGQYPNVRLFAFADGGSGSASRPRNKGVELANAPYLTFLDPDNEAICDGYAKLYHEATSGNFDLVLGNMYKCDAETRLADYYGTVKNVFGTSDFSDGFVTRLGEANFMSPSIQAMLIKKALVVDHHIEQVVGAVGQDTLFSWQLLQCAKKILFLPAPIHIYYAQTAGSVTNIVRASYFKKLLLLQQPKIEWLNKFGLIKEFMETKYDSYITLLVLKKLSSASLDESKICAAFVEKILDMYADYYKGTSPLINEFMRLCKLKDYSGAYECVQGVFPQNSENPTIEMQELLLPLRKESRFSVEYEQKGNIFTFLNLYNQSQVTYAWAVLRASNKYEKIFQTKYSKSPSFSYDFSFSDPMIYRIRAFVKNVNGKKFSEDIAYIRAGGEQPSVLLKANSNATKRRIEYEN